MHKQMTPIAARNQRTADELLAMIRDKTDSPTRKEIHNMLMAAEEDSRQQGDETTAGMFLLGGLCITIVDNMLREQEAAK